MGITADEVKYIAKLAKLRFNSNKIQKLAEEMESILAYFHSLSKMDLDINITDLDNVELDLPEKEQEFQIPIGADVRAGNSANIRTSQKAGDRADSSADIVDNGTINRSGIITANRDYNRTEMKSDIKANFRVDVNTGYIDRDKLFQNAKSMVESINGLFIKVPRIIE